jgi:hypothetical protein
VNEGDHPVFKIKGGGSYIFYIRLDVGFALAIDGYRRLSQDILDDGDIVRGKVPYNIDVRLEKPKINPMQLM